MPSKSFERRSFLKLLSAGIGAGFVSLPGMSNSISSIKSLNSSAFTLGKPEWILHEDGTFDIYAGSVRLINCRPTIDGQSIFVRNTFMGDSPKGKRIIYEIEGGFVMLDLRTHSNTISIGVEISGLKIAPAWVNPLGEGKIIGAHHFFKQGFGTGGKSGIFEFRSPAVNNETNYPEEDSWSYDSFLMTGLIADNGDTFAIGAYEQTDFIQRSSIYNQTHRTGLNESRAGKQSVFFEAGFATENILLKDEFIKLPDLYIYHGNQPFGTLQSLAWSISEENEARRDTDTNYYWSSFQNFHTSFSFQELMKQLKALDSIKPEIPLQTVLIGPGYCIPGDWMDTLEGWPKSMDDVARQIFQRRYRAGIYVAPFVVHEMSKTFRKHPHWILKDTEDNPVEVGADQNGKLYALDGNSEDVKNYLSRVFRNFRKMGFTYYELDYLDVGLRDSFEAKHVRKNRSSVQIFRAVMDIIRDEVGAGSFITANRTPYSPLIGYVDAVRIDKDQSWKWNNGTRHIFAESYNTQYFNNVFWQNDPDVIFLRNYKTEYTKAEQKSLALWAGFMGGSVGISDSFELLQEDRLQLWRFLEPVKRPKGAMLPFWGNGVVNYVAVRRYANNKGWGVLVLNINDEPVTETYKILDLTGINQAWIFAWEPSFSLGLGNSDELTVTLEPHESRLYFISETTSNPSLNLSISGKDYLKD